MARSGPVLEEKMWGWVTEVLGEPVPYGETYTVAWTRRVVDLLKERFDYRPRGMTEVRERCEVCRGRRRVTLQMYEAYFLGKGTGNVSRAV